MEMISNALSETLLNPIIRKKNKKIKILRNTLEPNGLLFNFSTSKKYFLLTITVHTCKRLVQLHVKSRGTKDQTSSIKFNGECSPL